MKNKKKNPLGAWFKGMRERVVPNKKTKYTKSERQEYKVILSKHAQKDLGEMPKEVLDEIMDLFQSGEFIDKSEPIDMEKLKEEEPEVYERLMVDLEDSEIINPDDLN